jgi:hypothetical protein
MSIKVFISYSHDTVEHRDRILGLSERLRQDGIETLLDRYLNGSPVQGWPRWMLDQLDAADAVLVVCSEPYYLRFRGYEQGSGGRGADWEGALITQEIYDDRSRTLKFVPVFMTAAVPAWVPQPLRGVTYYELTSQAGYDSLYDFLTGQAAVQPSPIGMIKQRTRAQVAALAFDSAREAGAAPPARPNENGSDIYNRALRQLADDRFEEALEGLSRAIAIEPAFALAYYNRGLGRYLKQRQQPSGDPTTGLDLAIDDFNRALELGFRQAIVYRNRGNVYSQKGDVPGALADYAQAIALEPGDPIARLNRGEVYEHTLQTELAIADYKAVLQLVTEPQYQDRARARLLALRVKPPRSSRKKR